MTDPKHTFEVCPASRAPQAPNDIILFCDRERGHDGAHTGSAFGHSATWDAEQQLGVRATCSCCGGVGTLVERIVTSTSIDEQGKPVGQAIEDRMPFDYYCIQCGLRGGDPRSLIKGYRHLEHGYSPND